MPDAQKVCRLLRYTLTVIRIAVVIQSLAQRGVGETPERPPQGWAGS